MTEPGRPRITHWPSVTPVTPVTYVTSRQDVGPSADSDVAPVTDGRSEDPGHLPRGDGRGAQRRLVHRQIR